MKKSFLPLLLLALLARPAFAEETAESRALAESRKLAQEFVQKLGGVLKQQLEAGGAESAIGVCKKVAPALAAEYSNDQRVVKRVSLKPRNSLLGKADAWEVQQLESFDRGVKEGKAVGDMEAYAVTEGQDGRWLRYVKAIQTQPMCLQCHGRPDKISENVRAILAKEYPDDQATGYSAGAVRGAISIRQKLN